MDEQGFGKCIKKDKHFSGRTKVSDKYFPHTCYVDANTYCSDLETSNTTTLAGKRKSAVACEGKLQLYIDICVEIFYWNNIFIKRLN